MSGGAAYRGDGVRRAHVAHVRLDVVERPPPEQKLPRFGVQRPARREVGGDRIEGASVGPGRPHHPRRTPTPGGPRGATPRAPRPTTSTRSPTASRSTQPERTRPPSAPSGTAARW